jgi:hypothetical protein
VKHLFARENTSKYQSGKLGRVDVRTVRISATSEACQMAGDKEKNQVSCQPAARLFAAYDGSSSSWN